MAGRIIITRNREIAPGHFASHLARYATTQSKGWYVAQIPSLANGQPASEWSLNLACLEDWSQVDVDPSVATLWRAPGFRQQTKQQLVKAMRSVTLRNVPVGVRERMFDVLRECAVDLWGLSLDLNTVSCVSRRASHHLLVQDLQFQDSLLRRAA